MLIDVTMRITGAKRRTYQDKVYCDVFVVESMSQGADSVGMSTQAVRADGVVVDQLRHKSLPGTFKCQADLVQFGKSTVLILQSVGDPVAEAVPSKPAARAA